MKSRKNRKQTRATNAAHVRRRLARALLLAALLVGGGWLSQANVQKVSAKVVAGTAAHDGCGMMCGQNHNEVLLSS